MKHKIKVLFVASEMTPIAKVGGLGDVIGSLPKALLSIGINVSVILPRYEHIDRKNLDFFMWLDSSTSLWKTRVGGVEVYLIDNARYLSRGPIYFERTALAGSKKEIDRFLFFSEAIFELIRSGILKFDVVHAHDWHASFLVKLLNTKFSFLNSKLRIPKTIFTIHNLANQGKCGGKNWMAEGIKNADIVTTVSETYAKEILTKEFGDGLESLLKKRATEKKLIGILNGIDYAFWPHIKRAKIKFQKSLGLHEDLRAPIFGLVARLTSQKGIGLATASVRFFIRKFGAEFVFLGQGEDKLEKSLINLKKKFPNNVFLKIGFDENLAHKIYSQSDFFLMPSLFEPSGLGQMISMRYGTVPVARSTGGLKDTIKDHYTGFLFKQPTTNAFKDAVLRAISAFQDKGRYRDISLRCKKENFSWSHSAIKYKALYISGQLTNCGLQ